MGYREDADALRARVARLEHELSSAHEALQRLRGERTAHEPGDLVEHGALLGAARALRLTRELPYPLPIAAFEEMAALARRQHPVGVGEARQVGRHLSIPVVGGELRVETDDHRTRIELVSNLGRPEMSAGIVAATLGWMPVLGGSVAIVAALSELLHAIWAVPATLGLTLAAVRELFRRAATRNERGARAIFEQLLDIARAHAPRPAVRVDVREDDASEDERSIVVRGERTSSGPRAR